MLDKRLLRLLGKNRKYIFYTVALMVGGLFANIGITASLCYAIDLSLRFDAPRRQRRHVYPAGRMRRDGCCGALRHEPSGGESEGFAGAESQKRPARERLQQDCPAGRSLRRRHEHGGADAGGDGGRGTAGPVLFFLPSAVFLRHGGARHAVLHHGVDGLADRTGAAGLCAVHPGVHYGGVQVCKKDFREVLGEVYRHGRRLPGQRAGPARAENLPGRRRPARQDERPGGGVSQNHHEGAGDAAGVHDPHGPGGVWGRGRRDCRDGHGGWPIAAFLPWRACF